VQYSHYYNPYKRVEIYFDLKIMKYHRVDSMVRVKELEAEIRLLGSIPMMTNMYDDLGHAIHHIQDMASPGHVVPVDHDLSDGFESFSPDSVKTALIQTLPMDCEFFRVPPPASLKEILRGLAALTYDDLSEKLTIRINGNPVETTWKDLFWMPSTDRSFGHYGWAGNNFGNTRFEVGGDTIEVPYSTYQAYKVRQMRHAVNATKRALWWLQRLGR
jgi:hypothetical protein